MNEPFEERKIEEFTIQARIDYVYFQLGTIVKDCVHGRYKCGIYLNCLDWAVDPFAKTGSTPEPEQTQNHSDNTWLGFMVRFLRQRMRNTGESLAYIAERGKIASEAVSNLADHELLVPLKVC